MKKEKTNKIDEIVKKVREDVEKRKKLVPFSYSSSEAKAESRSNSSRRTSFARTITDAAKYKKIVIIGELKFASPTQPHLGSPDDLLLRVKQYENADADAISIITEKHFFKGDVGFISRVKKVIKLPVLQKDFIIDEQQIYEAKSAGADALLLITRLVDAKTLKHFVKLCFAMGIEPVVEVFDNKDLEKAVATKTCFIAVNARDLDTFEVDVDKACKLMEKIPDRFIKLGFSGIQSKAEVQQYANAGAVVVLIGTSLMQAKNVKKFIHDLRNRRR